MSRAATAEVIDFETARQRLVFVKCRRGVAAQFRKMIVNFEGLGIVVSGLKWHACWLHASGGDPTKPLALAAAVEWFF